MKNLLQSLADFITEFAAIERATAKFIISTFLLAVTIAIPFLLYKGGLALLAAQPGWLRWMVAHL